MRSLRPSVFAILVLALPLMGCQKIFMTSLAEGLARDNIPISANISNDDAAPPCSPTLSSPPLRSRASSPY